MASAIISCRFIIIRKICKEIGDDFNSFMKS